VKTYRIAAIPGDGIGKEVVPEGIRVLDTVAKKHGFAFAWQDFDWSCERFASTGSMMPADGLEQLKPFDAIFFGAVGFPGVPDHVSLWGLLIPFRRGFDQYVNLRPVRLMPGIVSPLAGRATGDIDMWIVRENTEGEYSSIGGRIFEGTPNETVMQESVFTRRGTDRIMKWAFELARSRPKKHITSATKSNGIAITMPYWDERFKAMSASYPDVKTDQYHIDILTESVRRYSLGPRSRRNGNDRDRAVRKPESGARVSVALRAGSRFRAGHLRQENRQPNRSNLVRRAHARPSRAHGRSERRDARDRDRSRARPAHPRHRGNGQHRRGRQSDRGRTLKKELGSVRY
jgi:hypothetical protein